MTEYDRDNLNFLLKCTEEGFQEWYEQASEDDKQYANELLEEFADEVYEKLAKYMPDPMSATIH